ncbi:MAG: chorismate mutase [Chloroflexota bacterium]|jgi:chorismate mutase|nr:chorismate mutase [Chloroflexota bacterium]MEC7788926.1 chorismate mutase [Chloroflexota bacterium]|tara:strand:- start:3738 stop:4112 length:375 start_codon:yes stop_codon:yes gene_type:complete
MKVRGVRGATTSDSNSREDILLAARDLITGIIEANEIVVDDVASILFSTTADLNAEFPAVAARNLGFTNTALECLVEMNVPGSLARCIRVLMHVNSDKQQKEIRHIYLKNAKSLRADLIDDDSE